MANRNARFFLKNEVLYIEIFNLTFVSLVDHMERSVDTNDRRKKVDQYAYCQFKSITPNESNYTILLY